MPVYVYETTDDGPARAFELYQSIKDKALVVDPETGRPVRRVITGGMEMPRAKADPARKPKGGHSDSCACCNPLPHK